MDGGDKHSYRAAFERYGILFLLLTAGGFFYWTKPLVPSRPAETGESASREPGAWVNARLWQDPLEAARKAPQDVQELAKTYNLTVAKGDIVMPILLSGGESVADREDRLRTRYAVLSAFETAGYIPDETRRIYFLKHQHEKKKENSRSDMWVPYEWLSRNPLQLPQAARNGDGSTGRILLLWLDGNHYYENPMSELLALTKQRVLGFKDASWRMVGPLDSDMLQSFLKELQSNQAMLDSWPDLKLYSPRATADEEILKVLCTDCAFKDVGSDRDKTSPQKIQRTIASDLELAELLYKELAARGVNISKPASPQTVVLLYDWDTSYGRALPVTFAGVVKQEQEKKQGRLFDSAMALRQDYQAWPKQIRRVMYMGGLDGIRPGGEPPKDNPKKEAAPKNEIGRATGAEIERPEGESQLDYLRRVADKLALETEGKVNAIGVLGSDVYDKLLLLQALRPKFPNTLFFTTDLDARMLHPSESDWARNLVVASSFGLDVRRSARDDVNQTPREWEQLARGQPPFRDSYQTATYFAVLRAMGVVTAADVTKAAEPWIYEIGRTRAHRLPSAGQEEGESVMYVTRELREANPLTGWVLWSSLLAFLLLLAFLIYQIAFGPGLWRDSQWRLRAMWCTIYVGFVACVLVIGFSQDGPPEPLTWTEGVSVWPTELMRFIAGLLAVYYLVRAHQRMAETMKYLREMYSLPGKDAAKGLPVGFWKSAACLLVKGPFAGTQDIKQLWARYECCSAPNNRWPRVLLLWLVYFAFAACVFGLLGVPTVPYRGQGSLIIDSAATLLCVSLQLLLIFYVTETILLTERFVREMVSGADDTPPRFIGGWRDESLVPEEKARLSIDLIARLTYTVSSFILYPFIVLAIMIASRISYFDRWDWPIALIIVFGINGLFAIGSGVFLSQTVGGARQMVLEGLRWERIDAERKGATDRAASVGKAMEDVEKEERGAFVPLQKHPVLGAIALPSSSVLLAMILDFLDRSG